MIDTRKCKTYEERYDAIASEQFKMKIKKDEEILYDIKQRLALFQTCATMYENDMNRLKKYITAYETTYPNRPWEVVSIE